jgi:hypothetical protein
VASVYLSMSVDVIARASGFPDLFNAESQEVPLPQTGAVLGRGRWSVSVVWTHWWWEPINLSVPKVQSMEYLPAHMWSPFHRF